MRLRRFGTAVVAVVATFTPAGLRAQGPSNSLNQAIRSYQNLEYDDAAEGLRRALNRPDLPADQQEQMLSYLGASEFFLNHRDAAVAAFRQMLLIDPAARLDNLIFPPEVQRVFDEARKGVKAVRVDVPGRNAIQVGQTSMPVRLLTTSYHEIGVAITGRSGQAIHWLYNGPIADSIDVTWDGMDAAGKVVASGGYFLRITSRSPTGRIVRTVDVPLDVTLERADTLPTPRPLEPSQFLPERSKRAPLNDAARGLALGVGVLALPAIAGADSIAAGAPLFVGAAIAVAGAVAVLSHPSGKPIPTNVAYNRQIRENWERQVDEVKKENAERRKNVRLIVRTGEQTVREGAEQ
jgi:hypothetical protein